LLLKELHSKSERSKISGIDSRIKHEIWFVTAITIMYNNIEILKKISNKVNFHQNFSSFDSFIEMRNAIVHNIKPIVKIENGYYLVPKNFNWFTEQSIPDFESWIWSKHDFSGLKFQSLPEFFNWCIERTFDHFNNVLTNEIESFEKDFKCKSLISEISFVFPTSEQTSDIIL
jgi:hypothetical protein